MSDPYLKAIPNEQDDTLAFVMDRKGFELFKRLLTRTNPTPRDNQQEFNAVKDRISGAFLIGGIVMGWDEK